MDKIRGNIQIDIFDPDSIQHAIDVLEGFGVEEKCKELARRLAEIGLEEARVSYQNASLDGNEDVGVRIYEIPNGYAIEAYGEDVYFVEFGTGVSAGNGYDTGEITPPVPISSGSYSQTVGKGHFTEEHPYWWYDHIRYSGTRPYMGMYHASKAIKQNLLKVAQEVFT